ncbi:MAG: O-methyltransferase [Proteobacteria bacterium]|nr:O-methyltransferase [Pseudomonadota bacterium]
MNADPPIHNIVNPEIESYLSALQQNPNDTVLEEMERYAAKRYFPIVGRLAGMFLETMALSIGAKRVFEFGSGFGYSASWFARAVGEGGTVICCEYKAENCDVAEAYLRRQGLWDRIEYHNESALDVFAGQKAEFDLIFCDADKEDYPVIFELAKTKLRKGGLYIADNVLWDGQVTVNDEDEVDDLTAAIIRHNRLVANDSDFRYFINPVRDGLLAAVKLR